MVFSIGYKEQKLMVHPYDPNPKNPPDVAGFLHREASGASPPLPEADAAVAQRRLDPQVETLQSSLIERIAAVDDERRRNATQMHRAIESQRVEVAALASFQRVGVVLVAALMILLTVLSISFVLLQVERMQRDWRADLEQLQQQVVALEAGALIATGQDAVTEQPSAVSTSTSTSPSSSTVAAAVEATPTDSLTQGLEGQVAVLRERMVDTTKIKSSSSSDEIADSADAIADSADATANAQVVGERSTDVLPNNGMVLQKPVDAGRSAAVDRTSAPPESAVAEPAAPEFTTPEATDPELTIPEAAAPELTIPEAAAPELAAPESAASEPAAPDVDGAGTGSAAIDSAVQVTNAALAVASPEATDGSGAHQAPAMADIEAEEAIDNRSVDEVVDALIERRLGEVDREYQRLARELSAPAVRPRWAVENALSDAEDEAMLDTVDVGSVEKSSRLPARSSPERIVVADRPFALQLIGFHSRELLDDFVDRSPLPSRVYMREERFRGRPWFVLIYSLHQDRAAAQQASEALPDVLGKLDLWIRELSAETELDVIDTSGGQT